jgi:hypothetical protein
MHDFWRKKLISFLKKPFGFPKNRQFFKKVVQFPKKPSVSNKIERLPFSYLKFENLIFYQKPKTEKTIQ